MLQLLAATSQGKHLRASTSAVPPGPHVSVGALAARKALGSAFPP